MPIISHCHCTVYIVGSIHWLSRGTGQITLCSHTIGDCAVCGICRDEQLSTVLCEKERFWVEIWQKRKKRKEKTRAINVIIFTSGYLFKWLQRMKNVIWLYLQHKNERYNNSEKNKARRNGNMFWYLNNLSVPSMKAWTIRSQRHCWYIFVCKEMSIPLNK